MLDRIGLESLDELFSSIPAELKARGPLDLPPALTEMELTRHMGALAGRNRAGGGMVSFLGGGCYDHFVPAAVDAIAARPEFYTAYTPYQAEVSQGTLQVGFEFQSLICRLTGLDVANASMYEAGTACAEAALMAAATLGRDSGRVVMSETVNPEYRQTVLTTLRNLPLELVTVPAKNGVTDAAALAAAIDGRTAAVLVQSPNMFGLIEDVAQAAAAAKAHGAALVQAFDPVSLGVLKRPGDLGVDIAVAEGQSLGTPPSFGGPFLGIFACREKFLRRMPGRIVGETVDRRGNPCYVLTLQTREQHIRREKATSNICSNQALLALRASVFLALAGPKGLAEMAELCRAKSAYALEKLTAIKGVSRKFPGPFVKEFVVELPVPAEPLLPKLIERGYHAGVPLGRWYQGMERSLLVAVTEKRTREEIDGLAAALAETLSS
jgi:glycine dehydrogenase subunit 1